jgi:accessory gene regulator B
MVADFITNSFSKEGIISDEEKEIVRFGMDSLEGNFLGIILTLAVGICFKHTRDALILWVLLFPLRKNAGGYHAQTKVRCLFISTVMLIIAFTLFTVIGYTMTFYGICFMVSGCIIWFLAPIENTSKELDVTECKVYQKRTRIALGAEGIIFILALYFKWKNEVINICMTFFLVSISLLMGVMKLAWRNKFKR